MIKVDVKGFYESYFTATDENTTGEELLVSCPFHGDTKPSLSINLKSGLWKCHAQSCETNNLDNGGGNLYKFYISMERLEKRLLSYEDAQLFVNKEFGEEAPDEEEPQEYRPKPVANFPITEEKVRECCEALKTKKNVMGKLLNGFGWSLDTIEQFEIGWDEQSGRLWIPIREGERLVNIRRYNPIHKNKYLNIPNFGEARLWPLRALEHSDIYLLEGEKDCILANQLGLHAITVIGGAGTFKTEWAPLFLNKNVYIVYDVDAAGKSGAEKVASILSNSAREIKIVLLPITKPANADFTDYIMQGHTLQAFNQLVESTPVYKTGLDRTVTIPDDVINTSLSETMNRKLFFKRIRMKVRVIGKDLSPYVIPKKIHIKCNRNKGKSCYVCPNYKEGEMEMSIDETTPGMLRFIDCKDREHHKIVEGVFGLPSCEMFKYEVLEHQPVEEMEAIPSLETSNIDAEEKYSKGLFYLLNRSIDTNNDYEIEAIPVSDPRNQKLVYVGYSVKPCQSSVDEFQLDDEIIDRLRIFQCQISETN